MNVEKLLDEVIEQELKDLKEIELGTESYSNTVEGVTKLIDRKKDLASVELEYQEKVNHRENENYFRMKEIENESKDRKINYVMVGLGILIPASITIWGAKSSWRFEEHGTITSNAGREFMKRLFLRKKELRERLWKNSLFFFFFFVFLS